MKDVGFLSGVALVASGLWWMYPPLCLIALGGLAIATTAALVRRGSAKK